MAAKIFEIIGVVAIVIFIPIFVLIFHFLGKFLKKVNKSIGTSRSGIRNNISSTMTGLDGAKVQIEALTATTTAVSSGMRSAIGSADKLVAFLKSNAFQMGIPVALWTILAVVGLTRGLTPVKPKKKKNKPTPIPPPSWELESDNK